MFKHLNWRLIFYNVNVIVSLKFQYLFPPFACWITSDEQIVNFCNPFYCSCVYTCVYMPVKTTTCTYMYICDQIWENPTFCIFYQNWDFAILILAFIITSLLSTCTCIYNSTCTISEFITLCNAAINIADIEGGKLAYAHIQSRTLFKMLDFHTSGHIYMYIHSIQCTCTFKS